MKSNAYRKFLSLLFAVAVCCAASARAQDGEPTQLKNKGKTGAATEGGQAADAQAEPVSKKPAERLAGDEPASPAAGAKQMSEAERQALRREKQAEDEVGALQYMNNWFQTYRLGPEDVISVDVFGLAQYSKSNLVVPPDGKISYPLLGHVKVVGRTTEDIEKELTERLVEYIIEPKVSVQLVQARSQKVIVDGDVGKPGVLEMTRRMTVQEALAMAGPVLRSGSKTNIRLLRQQQNGERQLFTINLKELERGRGEDIYLVPGDIVFVPGNRFATVEKWLGMVTMAGWARMILR
jgi:polysaccharide biosynthesis/export protein